MKAVKIGSYVLPWVLSVIFLFSFITKLIEISDLPFYIQFYLSLFHIDIKDGIVNFIGYVLLSIELTLGIAWSQKKYAFERDVINYTAVDYVLCCNIYRLCKRWY